MFVFFKGEGDDFGLVQSKPAVEFSISKKTIYCKKKKGPDPKPGPLFSRSSAGITRIRFMGLISG
jgi:hypothetical protein